jgi:hypothetical protein
MDKSMNAKRHRTLVIKPDILLAILFTAGCLHAAEPLELEQGAPPDHLVPVEPRSNNYTKLIAEKLLLTSGEFGRMVYRPSFSGEFAVSVYGDDYTKDTPREPQAFRITLTKVKEGSIWASYFHPKDEPAGPPVEVARTDVTIDRNFAVAIQLAWGTMLLKTRYSSKDYRGYDGYTAEFSVWVKGAGHLFGETWSPKQGLPKELVELGQSLVAFCETPADQRPAKQRAIQKQLEAITLKAN